MEPMIWTGLYWAWLATEIWVAVATRTRGGVGQVKDKGTQLLLWVVIVASIVAAEWTRVWAPATRITSHGDAWRWLSVALMAAGLGIRWAAIRSLGKGFSANVAIRQDQRLYRGGLYGVVRHPSYLGLLVIFVAIGVHLRNGLSLVIAVVPPTAALLVRIGVEERALRGAFGVEYERYSREVKRLVPGVY